MPTSCRAEHMPEVSVPQGWNCIACCPLMPLSSTRLISGHRHLLTALIAWVGGCRLPAAATRRQRSAATRSTLVDAKEATDSYVSPLAPSPHPPLPYPRPQHKKVKAIMDLHLCPAAMAPSHQVRQGGLLKGVMHAGRHGWDPRWGCSMWVGRQGWQRGAAKPGAPNRRPVSTRTSPRIARLPASACAALRAPHSQPHPTHPRLAPQARRPPCAASLPPSAEALHPLRCVWPMR